jgi:Protein of unknown function (DUF3253)
MLGKTGGTGQLAPMQALPDDSRIAAEILTQVAASGSDHSITPSDVARALDADWRPLLGPVRRVAQALARDGRLDILRKGRTVAPEGVKGVIRLRQPQALAQPIPQHGDAT